MGDLYDTKLYNDDICSVATLPYPWEHLKNRSILITGASGMVGSFLIDVIMYRNMNFGDNCCIIAVSRNNENMKLRFRKYLGHNTLMFFQKDINKTINELFESVDYVFHAASNTHPVAYASDPIGTIATNIIGLSNLLEFALDHNTNRFIFASTVEVYGENRGDVEKFSEDYCGYINCNTMRAGYPESKRAGEALCQAYIKQKGLDVVIPRLSRIYGPTMLSSDTKAISQFIKRGVQGKNIVLKSKGSQLYSYSYVADAVSGVLAVLFYGQCGEAYNIADEKSDITLKDLSELIANISGTNVVFELPEKTESEGYSNATKAILEATKLKKLGWKSQYDISEGIRRTISILSNSKTIYRRLS